MSDILNFQSGKAKSADTAADIAIELGWIPKYVKTWTETDGTHGVICEWWEGMPAAGGMLTAENGVVSTATTGITVRDQYVDPANHNNDYAAGFVIGVGAQYDAFTIYWMAM